MLVNVQLTEAGIAIFYYFFGTWLTCSSSLTDIEKEKQGSTGDGTSGGSGASEGVSASLTPTIWNKTIPYDGETFHLEYMDLDEFLLENGIPVTLEEELSKGLVPERQSGDSQDSSVTSDEPAAVPEMPEEEQSEGDEDEEDSLSVSEAAEQEVSDETTTGETTDKSMFQGKYIWYMLLKQLQLHPIFNVATFIGILVCS